MTSAKRPLSMRLADLDEALAAAHVRVREVKTRHAAAAAKAVELREAQVEAFATGNETAAKKLQAQRDKAEAEATGPWPERVAGAERAVQRADAERVTYAMENYEGLIGERQPDAATAVDAVRDALTSLRDAHQAWHAVEQDVAALIALAGHDASRMPRFPGQLEDLVRDARRARGLDVPAPLPVAMAPMTINPEHDPDPAVREAARQVNRPAMTTGA